MVRSRSWVLLAALWLNACSSHKTCKLDSECGERSLCAHPMINGVEQPSGFCRASCLSDADCVMAGDFSASCSAFNSGIATTEEHAPAGNRHDTQATPASALKACLHSGEVVR